MNDEMKQIETRLEQATAPGNHIDPGLDASTAVMRETWLALGRLLESTQSEATEANVPHCENRNRHWRDASATQQRAWMGWALAAAVVLLVGATVLWGLMQGDSGPRPGGPGQGKVATVPKDPPSKAPGVLQSPVPAAPAANAALTKSELEWDDSLDDEIRTAGLALLATEQGWNDPARPVNLVYEQLQRIEKDCSQDVL
ncbi:MAG: hypothetical protein JW818_17565 [Pirellulales bacterium]|nr:hypothetical protein [Pirellulales bacterium]